MTALGDSTKAWTPRRLRAWLLTDTPASALQARCGRWYLTWIAGRHSHRRQRFLYCSHESSSEIS